MTHLIAILATLGADVDFARDVRPVLAEACFACHGPDNKTRKADLRLDTREGLAAAAKDVLERLTTADASKRMPPKKSGKVLTAAQVDAVRRWVNGGAKWSAHWAFEPAKRPPAPAVRGPWRVRNPIDAFILARLEKEGLHPSPEAPPEALVRRVTLDLTGLPPTPAEVDAFLADRRPDAYERLVDRLLASPHHGEQMATTWLDYARFADSNGFQTDTSRQMWPWRDWVIRAFNDNLPFDRFTVEQLAGDLLPSPTRSQVVATGFNRNHRLNGEGGIIGEEWRIETVIDRVDTTGLTWLGLTLGCARCHDHKYDPISQKEYYQLFAFFNNVPESGTLGGAPSGNTDPVAPVDSPLHAPELARLREAVRAAEASAAEAGKDLPKLVAAWEPGFRKSLAGSKDAWVMLEPKEAKGTGETKLVRQPDGSWLAAGKAPTHDVYTVTAPVAAGPLSGLLLECLPDASLPARSVGRAFNGNFVLTRVEAEVSAPSLAAPLKVAFARAEADYSQPGWPVANLLAGDPRKGWAADGPTRKQPLKAMLVAGAPVTVPDGATFTVRLRHEAIDQHAIGRFRLSVTGAAPATVALDGPRVPAAVRAALAVAPAKRTPSQSEELTKFYRATAEGPVKRADDAVAAARKNLAGYEAAAVPTVMVMKEGPPRDAFVLVRGQYDRKGAKVTAGLPAALPPLPAGAPVNRLGFARWVASADNPLTARVWVNRAWERYFGAGLVRTTENLGTQAEFPSHPELLDFLATEFVRLGWDMKAMQKLIVTSATYRQTSRVTPALLAKDPENRLLARGPRLRLPAEMVRDQALAASGLLVPGVGGPSVRPYMPEGVWDETSVYGDLRNYKADAGPGRYRRTMYTVWKRTAAPPTMLLFDAPNREVCTVRRSRTNTPLQALALLNEVTYVEAARALAARMLAEGGSTPAARLTHGFRLVTARKPTAAESRVLADGFADDLARFRKDPAAAKKLAGSDDAELAALTLAANVLLNLDETVTRE